MANSTLAMEPLINSEENVSKLSEHLHPLDVSLMKLCYLLENNKAIPGLVTTNDDITTPDAKSWIKVHFISSSETKEYDRDNVKLLESKDLAKGIVNPEEVVDELIHLETITPLHLAIQQKALDLYTEIPTLKEKLIHYTIRNGRVKCVKFVMNSYPAFPYEVVTEDKETLLHSAVEGGQIEVIQLILDLALTTESSDDEGGKQKIDNFLNARNSEGNTALHMCILNKKREPIRPLLKAGVKLNTVDARGNTLLHLAAERNEIEYIKRVVNYHVIDAKDQDSAISELKECFLIKNGNKDIPVLLPTDRAVIDLILKYSQLDAVVDKEMGCLIHKASADDNELLAQALVEKNIELQVVNSKGFSPLKIASKRGNYRVVKVLLTAGADPNYIGKKLPGFSALNNAVQFGQLSCAKLLIEFGANLVHRDMTNTALHSASYGGHPDVVEYLIKEVGMDINQRNNANRTPLYQSITQGHYSVAKVLLGFGADPNVMLNDDNETLVHIAVREGAKEILSLLLEAKARPDEPLRNGITPLMIAVQSDRDDYIPLIMAYGITLAKKDQEGGTIMHHIAKNNSCASAKYILKRIGAMKGITQEFQIYKNKNDASKSAYDIAIECHSEEVLKIFIRHAPKDYFRTNTQQIHRFYDMNLYDTLKEIIYGLITIEKENERAKANLIIFESTGEGKCNDKKIEHPIKRTLLHKLKDCSDPELKYHPIVSFLIDHKLGFHKWRYVTSFLSFLLFWICLSYALIQASTKCDSELWSYNTPEDFGRLFCEILCLIYFVFFTIFAIAKFFATWTTIYFAKSDTRNIHSIKIKYKTGKSFNFLSILQSFIKSKLAMLDVKMKFSLSALVEYLKIRFIFVDSIALKSFTLFVILRIANSPVQWSFAGITFIFFSLSLLKHSRIFPKLGFYVNNILLVFYTEIPTFSLVILVIIFAFAGGIHLGARQQSVQQIQNVHLPYPVCNSSQTAFFWFNPSLTAIYDLRRPLLSALILLLDGGAGLHEEDLLIVNFFFTFIYLTFAFLIIVLMLNILIAQFVFSFRKISSVNIYDYKFELLVDLELREFFLFGKFFRSASSIESVDMPLAVWNILKKGHTTPTQHQTINNLNKDFMRKAAIIEKELEKNSNSHDNLRAKVGELSRGVNTRLAEFGKTIEELNNLYLCVKDIGDLKEEIFEIKRLLIANLATKQEI